jgi:DNA (cytosine-5)-methyltransferase 3A
MKLLCGGSPCTYWSICKTHGRETEASGLGWELFLNYRMARDKFRPDYFLYENNKSISKAIQEKITEELGVEPVMIDSALVSAQKRQRLYWVGRRNPDGTYSQVKVPQPADRGILLRDILESGVCWLEKAYPLKAQYSNTSIANAVYGHFGTTMKADPIRVGTIENSAKTQSFDSRQYRVYSPDGKSVTLCGQGGGVGAKTGLYAVPVEPPRKWGGRRALPIYWVQNGLVTVKDKQYAIPLRDGYYVIRKLTVGECKRLQTVPDSYTFPVSDSRAYRLLGNGWTVDVIAHILRQFDGLTAEPVDVLSMYDGMAAGMLALKQLGVTVRNYFASEIDEYAITTAMHNFPEIVQIGDAYGVRTAAWDGVVW